MTTRSTPFLNLARSAALATAALALGGCASFNNLTTEVSTFGSWSTDRKPSTYAFERLPSQEVRPSHQMALETAARGALERAGFVAVTDPATADYLMQIGARVNVTQPWVYNEPLFLYGGWRGGRWGRGPGWGGFDNFGYGAYGRYGYGAGYGYGYPASFEHESALLIRDRRTGQLLYEARANFTGGAPSVNYLLSTLFDSSMKDFPAVGPNPRDVTVPIAKR